MMILGDNIFFSNGLVNILADSGSNEGATIFSYAVKNPSEFGVVEVDKKGKIKSLIEKPKKIKKQFSYNWNVFF